jgi:hypothetical protein
MARIQGTLLEEQYTLMIISRRFLPRMRNISEKFVEKTKTQLLSSITFPKNHSVYENMWNNLVDADWSQMTIYHL